MSQQESEARREARAALVNGLRQAIKQAGNPTVRSLATACNCAPSTISRVLNNAVVPRELVMRKLLRELHHRQGLDATMLDHLSTLYNAVIANQDHPPAGGTHPTPGTSPTPDGLTPTGHQPLDHRGTCETCGASIGDPTRHAAWHRTLNEQVSAAAARLFQEFLRSRHRRSLPTPPRSM